MAPNMQSIASQVDSARQVDQNPKIEIEHLYFTYGDDEESWIIKDFSLSVHDREFLGIVGPSGCGKSTLLNIVAGLLPATRGQVYVDGSIPKEPGPDRTMVFQSDAVFPWYTVTKNVEYGMKATGVPREERQQKIERYLDLVGLSEARDLYPRQLSGGMRKRVDIARALSMEPEVLLMDEPFASLDVMTKERLQEDFLEIWENTRLTVVFVTHDLEEALYLSERVVVMGRNPGRVERVVDVPLDHPRNLSVKTSDVFQDMRRDLAEVLHTMHGGIEAR